jgi:hypothetical protein
MIGFPSRKCSSTPVGFGQEYLSNEQGANTGAPSMLLTGLQPIFTRSLD